MVRRILVGAVLALAAVVVPGGGSAVADVPSGACALAPTGANLSEGVPTPGGGTPSLGTVRATMVFVDFPDAPANGPISALRDQLLPGGPNWFRTSSAGALDLAVTVDTSRYYRMPRRSADYGWRRGLTAAAHRLYIDDALAAVGRSTSFGGSRLLYIVPTRAAGEISFSPTYMGPVTAGDGTVIPRTVTFGQDMWGWGSKVLNHETGHAMGLPDLYAYSGEAHRFVGGWDVMGLISGPAPDLLAWHKWKLGWLGWNQVGCISANGWYTDLLTPVSMPGGKKMVVVRTSATRAVVVEARARYGLDAAACSTGVLVYVVDTAVASGAGPVLVKDSRPGTGCGTHGLDDAAHAPGTSFSDAATRTRVDVVGKEGENYRVTIGLGV